MNLALVILITAASVIVGTGLCFYLLHQAREVDSTLWILEHILCPIIRILVLLVVVSLVYPAIDANSNLAAAGFSVSTRKLPTSPSWRGSSVLRRLARHWTVASASSCCPLVRARNRRSS